MALVILAAMSLAWSQDDGEGGGGAGTNVATSTCLSGMKWTAGQEGSPEMHPGWDCIGCHSQGEGPSFLVAGTVYRALNEPNDCYGVQEVEVQLSDAREKVITMTTNASGNFGAGMRNASISFPFTAKVLLNGKENVMYSSQSTGNCASCHTQKGNNGAPGRILAPF